MIGLSNHRNQTVPKQHQITTGQKFGRLTVIQETDPIVFVSGPRRRFLCQCECSTVKPFTLQSLMNGKSQSCGCLRKEQLKERNTTHGHSVGGKRSPEHSAWHSMLQRCNNPKSKRYAEWGGRGITVCERWRTFDNFLADMGTRPSLKHSLDRFPDTNGDYKPGNCRWATNSEQCNNKRNNRLLTHNGRTQTITEWGRESVVPLSAFRYRIESGWPIEEALTLLSDIHRKFKASQRHTYER